MFIVYKYAGTVRYDLLVFENEIDAMDWCDTHDWHLIDENRFEWHLGYREA